MKYALSATQMKQADRNTIVHFGVASLVLQERAALAVCAQIEDGENRPVPRGVAAGDVMLYAGCGNNGADALAVARILHQRGFRTRIRTVGNREKATEEFRAQLKSAEAYGLPVYPFDDVPPVREEDAVPEYVIDGLLGVGMSRAPEGAMADAIHEINGLRERGARVIAIDLPSGVNADDGTVPGEAVMADLTVTFGFMKTGQLLFPGSAHCGNTLVADIGITED
ncbi:MAG: NAD(P)H-hydrate epimerase, partial [Butyrivibrio sp.]|nr:NAD(P)H-hydrate epimerase [Butyrivibrio sp.]